MAEPRAEPSETTLAFMQWLQQGLAGRAITYNEAGAPVHFVPEGIALVSPLIFRRYASEAGLAGADAALKVQAELLRAGWHRVQQLPQGHGRSNIARYEVIGRGGKVTARLAAVVLAEADRWVQPLPPPNPVLRLVAQTTQA